MQYQLKAKSFEILYDKHKLKHINKILPSDNMISSYPSVAWQILYKLDTRLL